MLNQPKLPTIMQITTNLQDQKLEQEFISTVLNPISQEIQDFIDAPDSPLGDINANLLSIQWLANDNLCTCIITFTINPDPNYDGRSIKLAADEACTAKHALPQLIWNCFDNPLESSSYTVTDSALIFIATTIF